MRGLPFDEPAEELRRGRRYLCHELERDQRRLRGLPRPGIGARTSRRPRPRLRRTDRGTRRASRRGVDHRYGHGQCPPQPAEIDRSRARRLRAVPFAAWPVLKHLSRRRTVPGSLSTGVARIRPLPSGRSAARRGLRLGFVSVESDACGGRDLQRLPRAARGETARARQRRLRAVPRGVEIRGDDPSHARTRHAWQRVQGLSHADGNVHGDRSAARPQLPDTSTRLERRSPRPERLQPVSRRSNPGMGGSSDSPASPAAEIGLPAFRRGVRCGGPG